jgi:pimeloyl-ACP methyl ester carboxylesterase
VGAWRPLHGSAFAFDEAFIRALEEEDRDRTPNPLTAFNHAGLADATSWVNRLDEIRRPVLIIHATADPMVLYAHGLALQKALRNSRLLILPGTGDELQSGRPQIRGSQHNDATAESG